jgi:hypothetical protein
MATELRIQPLAASTAMLAAENTRLLARREELETELHELQEKLLMATTRAESRSIQDRMTAHREALATLEREQKAERDAERAAEERAQKALLKGRARDLVEAEDRRLEAIGQAERALEAFVEAVNVALAHGEVARRIGGEIASHRGLRMHGALSALSGAEAEARVGHAISAHLSKISVPGRLAGGRVGSLQLPGATMHRPGSWVEIERGKVAADLAELLNVEKEGVN